MLVEDGGEGRPAADGLEDEVPVQPRVETVRGERHAARVAGLAIERLLGPAGSDR